MSVTRFQQLGGLVGELQHVSEDRLARFSAIGGRWVTPVLAQLGYPDDHDPSCQRNLAYLPEFKILAARYNVAVGGWFNGWAGGELGTSAADDAVKIAAITHQYGLTGPVLLDLEAAYQWPGGKPNELPKILYETRRLLPTRGIIVSTNSPNDSMVWNGGGAANAYHGSMWRCGMRLAPQWYPWMGQWGSPTQTMQWAKAHGMEDNMHDPKGPSGRAIPLSYWHGTLETTGLEGSELAPSIADLEAAFAYGATPGFSLYLLEAATDDDFNLVATKRGKLYLV